MPTTPGFGGVPGVGIAPTATGAMGRQPEYHHVGSDAQDGSDRLRGPWKLYDEKYLWLRESTYRPKGPQAWLNDLRDYWAGKTAEFDRFFAWIELQENDFKSTGECSYPMLGCQRPIEMSRQLWALLGGLIKDDATIKRTCANVPRRNGFEVWRGISEPVNEDKALTRKDLTIKVTNPRAANMDDLSKALEDWETSKRLFAEADGKLPDDNNERLAFIDMLPPDVRLAAHGHARLREVRQDQEVRHEAGQGHAEPAPQAQECFELGGRLQGRFAGT